MSAADVVARTVITDLFVCDFCRVLREAEGEGTSGPASDRRLTAEQLEVELEEARAHQRAAAEVLKVIAEFPNKTQPVFDAIAKAAEINGLR